MTIHTEIVALDEGQLRLVQTTLSGGRRELVVTVKAPADSKELVPMVLDDGRVIRASGLTLTGEPGGYRLETGFIATTGPAGPKFGLVPRPSTLDILTGLLGVGALEAQVTLPELAVAAIDSFSAPVQSSGSPQASGPQSFAEAAAEALTSPTSDLVEVASEVRDALQGSATQSGTLGRIADGAKSAAGVIKHAAGTFKTYQDYKAREAMLAEAYDCAENPTEPTAIDAMRNDPNYHRATTERIKSARNELKLHYGAKIFSSTVNQLASTLLDAQNTPAGKAWSKVVGIIDKAEDAMLNHVEEEYILKDATKGVVPCRNTCEAGYHPAPPPAVLASYPPASMSCGNPAPEQLVCSAGPPAPVSSSPPPPPTPPPTSLTCGLLTSAVFTYTFSESSSGCVSIECSSSSRDVHYQGSAALKPAGSKGYDGQGSGSYIELQTWETSAPSIPACTRSSSVTRTAGAGELRVTARFTVASPDVGGIDTGGMSADTTVVEIMLGGEVPMDVTQESCEGTTSFSSTNSLGMDCHFYGIDLYRTGFYKVYKNGEPGAGECTLSLSR
jgi:hypothetical protein